MTLKLPTDLEYLRPALDTLSRFDSATPGQTTPSFGELTQRDIHILAECYRAIRERLDAPRLSRWMSVSKEYRRAFAERLRCMFETFSMLAHSGRTPFCSYEVRKQPILNMPERWRYLERIASRYRWVVLRAQDLVEQSIAELSGSELEELAAVWREIIGRSDEGALTLFAQDYLNDSIYFFERDACRRLVLLFERLAARNVSPFGERQIWQGSRPTAAVSPEMIALAIPPKFAYLATPASNYLDKYDVLDASVLAALTTEQKCELQEIARRWKSDRDTPEGRAFDEWMRRPPKGHVELASAVDQLLILLATLGWLGRHRSS